MPKVTIYYNNSTRISQAPEGKNLLELLREQGCFLPAACGGVGTCGKCLVTLSDQMGKRQVLACRTPVTEDLSLWLSSSDPHSDVTAVSGSPLPPAGDPRTSLSSQDRDPSGSFSPDSIGAAVDLGTTTVAVRLYDLTHGRLLGQTEEWNRQISYGADVIARVRYCMEQPGGLAVLGGLIRGQIRDMIRELTPPSKASAAVSGPAGDFSRPAEESPFPTRIVVAGNTIMEHIFAGLDPSSIARAPYLPQSLFSDGKGYSFPEFPGAEVSLLPCISGFVGGDITAGLSTISPEKAALYLDIGTNGEMALFDGDHFLCCSVACGPAFEGSNISCGMRSIPGAVSHVGVSQGRIRYQVIGDAPAAGLCGSGLIDLTAALLSLGIIDSTGRLLSPPEVPRRLRYLLSEDEKGNGIFRIGFSRTLGLQAEDVRQVQLAKAALAAGVETLLEGSGMQPEEISGVRIAGGFGLHLNPESVIALGMLPDCFRDRMTGVGNRSLEGASDLLLGRTSFLRLQQLQKKCRYVELSADPAFSDRFVKHMSFLSLV